MTLEAPPYYKRYVTEGDVSSRWKLGAPKSTLKKPRGVAPNPKHKKLMDMHLDTVRIFYFLEFFWFSFPGRQPV